MFEHFVKVVTANKVTTNCFLSPVRKQRNDLELLRRERKEVQTDQRISMDFINRFRNLMFNLATGRILVKNYALHSAFFSAQKSINFLCNVSDHLARTSKLNHSENASSAEIKKERDVFNARKEELSSFVTRFNDEVGPIVFGELGTWDKLFPEHLKKFVESCSEKNFSNKSRGTSTSYGDVVYRITQCHSLLRMFRNFIHHLKNLDALILKEIGSDPEAVLKFFTTNFPALLTSVHVFASNNDLTPGFSKLDHSTYHQGTDFV